jgi:hypothetical protein
MHYPFKSDGCSVVSDYDQQECCVRHDWLYWQGGSIQDRARADREFFQCVRRTRSGWLAAIRWLGVRIGGLGFLPFFDWRWGYGWEYPRSRAPENDNSPYTVETERAAFEKRLAEAREQDRLAREKRANS